MLKANSPVAVYKMNHLVLIYDESNMLKLKPTLSLMTTILILICNYMT